MMNQGGVKASIGVHMQPFSWHNAKGIAGDMAAVTVTKQRPEPYLPGGFSLLFCTRAKKQMKIREIRPEKEKDAKGIHWLPHL